MPPRRPNKPTLVDREAAQAKNQLIAKVGVTSVMIIFFIIWMFVLKYEFSVSTRSSRTNSGFDLNQVRSELDKTMQKVKEGIAEIKAIQQNSQSATSSRAADLTPEQLDLLKGKLLDGMASGTETINN
ncbi:MAG: hypothetical protein PHS62_00775 [Patescibacteria group bacterium]|nr:hypothetical protein [Patescibacteria group bacterium]